MGRLEELIAEYGLEWKRSRHSNCLTDDIKYKINNNKNARDIWCFDMSGNGLRLVEMKTFVEKTGADPFLVEVAKKIGLNFYGFYFNDATQKYEFEVNAIHIARKVVDNKELLYALKPEERLKSLFTGNNTNGNGIFNELENLGDLENRIMNIAASIKPGLEKLNKELYKEIERMIEEKNKI